MDEQKTPGGSGTESTEKAQPGQKSPRKLYKSRSNRMVDGVCGGIAEYLGVDAAAIRLLLVAFTILSIGAGVIFYISSMIIIPMKSLATKMAIDDGTKISYASKSESASGATATLMIGVIVIIIGVTLLFDYYDIFSVTSMWHSFGRLALPIIFILIGGALLLGRGHGELGSMVGESEQGESHDDATPAIERRKLFRSNSDKKVSGVCGGFAEYFDVDSTIVRLIFVSLAFASFGLALILYIVCALVIPNGNQVTANRDSLGMHSEEVNS